MGFKRAQWHSGLTYQQTCETCKTVLQYTDYSLDYRPWYADGFVDCPKCKSHLRHNENYAIDARPAQTVQVPAPVSAPAQAPASAEQKPAYMVEPSAQAAASAPVSAPAPADRPLFCTNCGSRFGEADRFCAQCGTRRG